jgi:CheY-like chemotaxis protein
VSDISSVWSSQQNFNRNLQAMSKKQMRSPVRAQRPLQLECQNAIATTIPQPLPAPKRLLMVNAEPNFLVLVRDYLEFLGYEVVTAKQGLEALEILEHTLPDAMIIGDEMSELSHHQFERLREEHSQYRQIPVVLLTDRESPPANGYFYAPVQPEKLIAVLQSVLEQSPELATNENLATSSQELRP